MEKGLCSNILVFFLFILIISCSSPDKSQQGLPNIIYILADDLGYGDLGVYGQEKFHTPNLDRLAREGMVFTQHYSGTSVCAPSRASLMTGMHTGHTYVRGNRRVDDGQFPLPEHAVTVPKVLKKAGYATGAFGKWGLGYPGSSGDPLKQGFDTFFGYNSQTIAHNYYPWELNHDEGVHLIPENDGSKQGIYAPDLIHEKTLEFIRENKDNPFFAYLPNIIPHAELFAPEAYMDRFLEKASPESNLDRRSKFDPETPYEGIDDPSHARFKLGGYGSQQYPRAAFAAMMTLLDDQVGEIMELLAELGIAENTMIVFSSDNGPHQEGGADPDFFNSNGPFRGYKRDLYEGGIRTPMLVKWPKQIPAGSQTNHLSAFWDVLPTFAEMAGVEIPGNTDGISFLPTLLGEPQPVHDYLYWEFHEQGGKQAIRKGDWKAIRLNAKQDTRKLLLYDLSVDVGETKDLAADYPDRVEEMLDLMQGARTEDPEWPFIPTGENE